MRLFWTVRGTQSLQLRPALSSAVVALALLCISALPTQVSAQQIEDAHAFDLVVTGAVREQCAMGSIADIDFGNLERPGLGVETEVPFYCNIPFTMTVNGARGALAHSAMPQGQGPYAGRVDYSVGVTMPVRNPARRILTKQFTSRQIQAGGIVSSDGGIATDGMTLSISLSPPPSTAGLLAGDYSETITITVAPL